MSGAFAYASACKDETEIGLIKVMYLHFQFCIHFQFSDSDIFLSCVCMLWLCVVESLSGDVYGVQQVRQEGDCHHC